MKLTTNQLKKLVVVALGLPLLAVATLVSGTTPASGAVSNNIAAVYKSKCAGCHGADGSKNLNVQGKSDDELYNAVAQGVKGKMPGYEKSLGADQCNALVGYIKELKP
jgi:mono/diheme cytochrome c family protein